MYIAHNTSLINHLEPKEIQLAELQRADMLAWGCPHRGCGMLAESAVLLIFCMWMNMLSLIAFFPGQMDWVDSLHKVSGEVSPYLLGTLAAIAIIIGTGWVFFSRWAARTPLRKIAVRLRFLWNTALAFGILFYIVRYKLETDKYFPSYDDARDPYRLIAFLSDKWEVLVLGTIFLITLLVMNIDNARYIEHAENCFSRRPGRTPTRWTIVRGRYLILWVILSNIAIFLALAYFTDNIILFSGLFAVHHLNAVIWIVAFRWNVAHYFYHKDYIPPDDDPYRGLIYERRKVMETFLSKTSNIERESLTATGYAVAFSLALANQIWHITFYAAPHIIAAIVATTNQYFSYRERRERDRGLRRIAEEESRLSTAD